MNGRKTISLVPKQTIPLFLASLLWLATGVGSSWAGPIQDLIDAAPAGGTVTLGLATYVETLTVNKNLTIQGVSSAGSILQSPAAAGLPVISVGAGSNLTLKDLTVTGGQAPGKAGGGVFLAGGSLALTGVAITGNSADYGGGVFQEGSGGTVTATDSVIQGNAASYHGGGIYVRGSLALTNTQVKGNSAGSHGGGVHVDNGGATTSGGLISGNSAGTGNGGGLNVNNDLAITGTQFLNNTAGDSGGAVTQWNGGKTVSISGATFQANSSRNKGGAAYIGSSVTLTGSTFTGNVVDSGGTGDVAGGGLYTSSPATVTGTTFTGNEAKCPSCSLNSGGGLAIQLAVSDTSTSTVNDCAFEGNKGWFGGGLYAGYGTLSASRCVFTNNSGGYGGGLEGYVVDAHHLTFEGNSVMNFGAGAYVASLTGDHLAFLGNTGGLRGGGLYVGHVAVSAARFAGNTATNGGGLYASGSVHPGGLTLANSIFAGNSARGPSYYGSAVFVDSAPAILTHVTVTNPARSSGPGLYIAGTAPSLEVRNSIVAACGTGIEAGAGSASEDFNLFFDNGADASGASSGGHSISGQDPLFVGAAGGDYHLQAGSPAVNLGADFGVAVDLDGRPRLNGRFDAGAYQHLNFVYLPLIRR